MNGGPTQDERTQTWCGAGVIALIVGLFTGCGSTNSASNATSDGDSNSGTTATYSVDGAKDSIRIASGSENKEVSGAIE